MTSIETDYLVVGAGAMGMAFTDTLVAETDAQVVVVDRGHSPGGHWNSAYPFVRLHQPSAYYGVNSRALGSDSIDQLGWNEGLYELATVGEICAYFEKVMHQDLLPSGRVSYFPMSEYLGEGRFRSLAGGDHTVTVRRRIVDATYLQTTVPSMRPPVYQVADGVDCVPPNGMPAHALGRDRFVVVGAGKTGIDACLWLLRNGIPPERLTWIMPRDSWLMDRANIQPGPQFLERFQAGFAHRLVAIEAATDVADLFDRLEDCGNLLRLDPSVQPTMYRCANVTTTELEQLRRIGDVVRLGRVQRIEPGRVILDGGEVSVDGSALFVDCSADGLEKRLPVTVFDGDRMTLQSIRGCQQVFSSGMIAHVEAAYGDDETRNRLCRPVPHPNTEIDWLTTTLAEQRNQVDWFEDGALMGWLSEARLDLMRHMYAPLIDLPQKKRDKVFGLIATGLRKANDKLETLLAAHLSTAPQATEARR
ncbi:NAD(P)-binding protein [Candidatus Mycobacterium wuenschmannii]|uniref:NAD(P)-binding protein n=1 Tax=Candidatus Mycobacterium wuenschmannii TaxID=3027808 RepID=A0ABY8VWU6_9MYCO|nr:NAD(P)-binding protein [Candidatus Mycobacterium wuenschmannii]WIM87269.1 NAD(P)-binding protein [Candidatus Mycobacterium wuenschmannii]